MSPEARRIATAEACGWKPTRCDPDFDWHAPSPGGGYANSLPDYLSDLNACHKAEQKLTLAQRDTYQQNLCRVCELERRMAPVYWLAITATAEQRNTAFLMTVL